MITYYFLNVFIFNIDQEIETEIRNINDLVVSKDTVEIKKKYLLEAAEIALGKQVVSSNLSAQAINLAHFLSTIFIHENVQSVSSESLYRNIEIYILSLRIISFKRFRKHESNKNNC